MNIEQIRDALPDYARDLKLNLGTVLTTNGAPGLNEKQIWSIALASAIAARNTAFARSVEAASRAHLADLDIEAAKAAAAIMGMNNIYYRFLHLVEDGEYQTMPARLRMNVIANHGIDKLDFELISLAVSAVNGCGLCVTSHEKKLRAHDVSREAIQSAVRIAATIHAVAGVLEFEQSQPVAAGAADLAA
ncbi:MAG TPA: carboxymuconolactone decarboxylase family protein [Steroidobacteraceae bacterium]|nr:carboxymuconolactone decarboxylase family protein [Steroidobacteraceae bacterium]